jgi:hypothetical protein
MSQKVATASPSSRDNIGNRMLREHENIRERASTIRGLALRIRERQFGSVPKPPEKERPTQVPADALLSVIESLCQDTMCYLVETSEDLEYILSEVEA